MHFSTHVKILREALRACLSTPKKEMLSELQNCLLKATRLSNSSEFDFYIAQFELLELEEFATTRYAVDQVSASLAKPTTSDNTLKTMKFELSIACEYLLAYTVDDWCDMQSEFHWYFCVDKGFAYKKSGLGTTVAPNGEGVVGISRVAKVSELPSAFRTNLI